MDQLEGQLRTERQEVSRLKEEVALSNAERDYVARLKAELSAYKAIVRVNEWDAEVDKRRNEMRSVTAMAEASTELRRKQRTTSVNEEEMLQPHPIPKEDGPEVKQRGSFAWPYAVNMVATLLRSL